MRHLAFMLCAIIFLSGLVDTPWAYGETYGQLRALNRRAVTVILQRNDFVARVLRTYDIQYQNTKEGVVNRLLIGNSWIDINRIEIVPLMLEEEHGVRVTGHEIFFYTKDNILHLASELTIR